MESALSTVTPARHGPPGLTGYYALLFIVSMVIASYWDVVSGSSYVYDGELALVHYPFLKFVADSIASGNGFPFWTKGVFMGFPMAYDSEISLFYPANTILLLFPNNLLYLLNLVSVLHLVVAGIGAYWLSRKLGLTSSASLASGIVFSLNGFVVSCISQLMALEVIAWTPFLVGLSLDFHCSRVTSKPVLTASLILGLMLLAGMYQYLVMALIFSIVWSSARAFRISRAKWGRHDPGSAFKGLAGSWAVVLLLGSIMGSIQYVPSMIMATSSSRYRITFQDAAGNEEDRLAPRELLDTVAHFSFLKDNVKNGPRALELNSPFHLGAATVLFVLLGIFLSSERPLKIGLAIGALLSVLSAAGPLTPVFGTLYTLFYPFVFLFKDPNRYLFFATLPVSLLAGLGVQSIEQRSTERIAKNSMLLGALAFCLLLFFAWLDSTRVVNSVGLDPGQVLNGGPEQVIVQAAILLLVISTSFLFNRISKIQRFLGPALVLSLALGVTTAGHDQERRLSPNQVNAFHDPAGMLAEIARLSKPGERYMAQPYPLKNNAALLLGLENVSGQCSTLSKRLLEFSGPSRSNSENSRRNSLWWDFLKKPAMARLTSAAFVVLSPGATDFRDNLLASGYTIVSNKEGYVLLHRDDTMPRAWFVKRALPCNRRGCLDIVSSRNFRPAVEAAVEMDGPEGLKPYPLPDHTTNATVLDWSEPGPDELIVRVSTGSRAFLVLNQSWHPDLKAHLDGRDTRLFPTDHVLCGVLVPPGKHEIRLRFEPSKLWRACAVLSVLTFLLLVSRLMSLMFKSR